MQYGGTTMAQTTAPAGFRQAPNPFADKSPFMKGQRKRLNVVAIAIALLLPWALFCASTALLSFKLHYSEPVLTYCMFAAPILVCLFFVYSAAKSMKDKITNSSEYDPKWFIFLAFTSILAVTLGGMWGQSNFYWNFEAYYDLINMGTYKGLDTSALPGKQVMDVGRVIFTNTTVLGLGMSMGFKSKSIYCVAPIVPSAAIKDPTMMKTYDFWAVGKDCCSGTMADFHCPFFSSPEAYGGVRLMEDADRAYYRLAVQQAEATYKITATHPLFFTWSRDPIDDSKEYLRTGYRNFFMGICCYFVLQAFMVAVATLAFSRIMHY